MVADVDTPSRWEQRTTVPFVLLSVAFIVVYSVTVLDEDLSVPVTLALHLFLLLVWVGFAVDYVVRLVLSTDRGGFFRRSVPDLVSVLVPVFRPFKLFTYLAKLPYFQGRSGGAFRTRVVLYAVSFAAVFVYTISLAVLQAERNAPGATITSFSDSIWWACVTITTVGYGDVVPVTAIGRILAVILMAGGIVIVGISSATVISFLNERIARLNREKREGDGQ